MPVLRQGKCLDPLCWAIDVNALPAPFPPVKEYTFSLLSCLSSLSDHAIEGDDLISDFRGEPVTQLSQSVSSSSSEHSDWLSEGRAS